MSAFPGSRSMPACRALIAMLSLTLPGCGMASPAGPGQAQFDAALQRAKAGTAAPLPAGDYGEVQVTGKAFSPAITLDARAARFSKITIRGSSGITIDGGTVIGTGAHSYGISILQARDVAIRGMQIIAAYRGIVVDRSQGVVIAGNQFTGLVSDGINIAYSQRVSVTQNVCRDFRPAMAVFAPDGTRLRDGDHPDCIQAWSRPQYAPTSDLTITDNQMTGQMQGIFLGNHVRNGVDDGGFYRVVIRNNRVTAGLPNAIYAAGVRGGEISGNIVATAPGALLHRGAKSQPVRAKLYIDGVGVRACGNSVADVPRGPGTGRC